MYPTTSRETGTLSCLWLRNVAAPATPGAPFPFSALWEGQHQQSRFVNSQGLHLAVFRNGENVKRSGRGLQIKTTPHFIAHRYSSVVRTGRRGSGSVRKPPSPALTQGSSLLTQSLAQLPQSHRLSVLLCWIQQHHGALSAAGTQMAPSPAQTDSTGQYHKEPLHPHVSPGNMVKNNFTVILLQ